MARKSKEQYTHAFDDIDMLGGSAQSGIEGQMTVEENLQMLRDLINEEHPHLESMIRNTIVAPFRTFAGNIQGDESIIAFRTPSPGAIHPGESRLRKENRASNVIVAKRTFRKFMRKPDMFVEVIHSKEHVPVSASSGNSVQTDGTQPGNRRSIDAPDPFAAFRKHRNIDLKYAEFTVAHEFIKNLNFKSAQAYLQFVRENRLENLPYSPKKVYGDLFINWYHYLGKPKDKFLSYTECREWMKENLPATINSSQKWFAYKDQLPANIPIQPHVVYKDMGWRHWGAFFGDDNRRKRYVQYLSFEVARRYAQENLVPLGIVNSNKWYSGRYLIPEYIPANPCDVYKDQGWIDWGDFLGTNNTHPSKRTFWTYEESKQWVKDKLGGLGILIGTKWYAYARGIEFLEAVKLPEEIPMDPFDYYSGKDTWKGWDDFLGISENLEKKPVRFRSYADAQSWVAENLSDKIKGQILWRKYVTQPAEFPSLPDLPRDIPHCPQVTYKNAGWRGWTHWFIRRNQFIPYKEAREWTVEQFKRNKGTKKEWSDFIHGKNMKKFRVTHLPANIPPNPAAYYKNTGWVSWDHFFGKTDKDSDKLSYKEACLWMRRHINGKLTKMRQWKEYVEGATLSLPALPANIPKNPSVYYKDEWISWGAWGHGLYMHP